MTRGLELWKAIKAGFLAELDSMSQGSAGDRRDFWSTPRNRTDWYLYRRDAILVRVAQRLHLPPFAMEVMNFDGLFKDQGGFPQIFVEVENNANLVLASELRKLCYVRAPLKLLITVSVRSKVPDRRSEWLAQIAACARWLPKSPEVVYGFITGDGLTVFPALSFEFFAASSTGEELLDERSERSYDNWFPEEALAESV